MYEKLLAAAMAVLVVTVGAAAAVPGHANGETDSGTDAANATDDAGAAGPPVEVGPPGGLPDPVPEFVGDLHGTIQDHVTGALDGSLGESIRGLVGGDAGDESDGGANDDAAGDTDAAPA
jgi:hypothetical protein